MNYLLTRTQTILTPTEAQQFLAQATQDLKSFELQLQSIQALIQTYLKYDSPN